MVSTDGGIFFKKSLFKDESGSLITGARHLQTSFANFSESNIDLAANFNWLANMQGLSQKAESECQRQARLYEAYPALRDSQIKAHQLAQAELQGREAKIIEITKAHEKQINELANALYKSGHIEPSTIGDLQRQIEGVEKSTQSTHKTLEESQSDIESLMKNQKRSMNKLGALERENRSLRDALVDISKREADLSGFRDEFNLEKSNWRALDDTIKGVQRERDEAKEEIKALRGNQESMTKQLQSMQDHLSRLAAPCQTSMSDSLAPCQNNGPGFRVKVNQTISDSERIEMLWSIVIGDVDDDQDNEGILEAMKKMANTTKGDIATNLKTQDEATEEKIRALELKIKTEFNDTFIHDLNANLNPLEDRLSRLEGHGGPHLGGIPPDIRQAIDEKHQINEQLMQMQLDDVSKTLGQQNRRIAEVVVKLGTLGPQQPPSAPPSKAGSPSPHMQGSSDLAQRMENIQKVQDDHQTKWKDMKAAWDVSQRTLDEITKKQGSSSDHIGHVSDRLSRLTNFVFGPSFQIDSAPSAMTTVDRRITAVSGAISIMRDELEKNFKERHDEHERIFTDFKRSFLEQASKTPEQNNKGGCIVPERKTDDPLKELTEIPDEELAIIKKPSMRKATDRCNNPFQHGQETPRSPGPMSPTISTMRTMTPQTIGRNSPHASGSNGSLSERRLSNLGPGRATTSKGQKPSKDVQSIGESRPPISNLQNTPTARKRGHYSDSDSSTPLAKKRDDKPRKSRRAAQKPRDSDPAAYEDPRDEDYMEEQDENVSGPQGRSHRTAKS